jgi:hypothetical protein
MRTFLACIFVAVAMPLGPSLAGGPAEPEDPQYIYCAERVEECFLYCPAPGGIECPRPDTMYIFICANDPLGVVRAHFRLEAEYPCCDSIEAVLPCPGVAIESGDLSQGMTISFPLQRSGHFKALALVIRHDGQNPPLPMSDYGFWVRGARLERENDESVPVYGWRTMPFYPDCYMTWPLWYHADTVDACIGSRTSVKIRWSVEGAYPGMGGWPVTIADDMGWVGGATLDWAITTGCLTCPWHEETDYIYIDVPAGTAVGTLNELTWSTASGINCCDSLVLRAVPPIATEKQSWGTLKDLFK